MSRPASAPDVAVVGSISLDIVCEVDALPGPGETVLARRTRHNVGGKGSNQAVAAARAGARVAFVGRTGDDDVAETLRGALSGAGVAVDDLLVVPRQASGRAYIWVADDNEIVVDPGANLRWEGEHDAERHASVLAAAAVVVTQLEIPMAVVEHVSNAASGRFVLNAAPAGSIPDAVLGRVDPLVVNEHELAAVTGEAVGSADDAVAAMRRLVDSGVPSVVTTLGAAGAVWADESGSGHVAAPATTAVDTTGAGDAFVGYLAAALATGTDLEGAVGRATVAASLSVGSPGTHDSYPDSAAVAAALSDAKA